MRSGQRASKVFPIERRRVDEGVVEGVVAGRRGRCLENDGGGDDDGGEGRGRLRVGRDSREATVDAAAEPMLSSYLYASILSHETLEQSLSFVLANKLADSTLLPTQLMEIFNTVLLDDETRRDDSYARRFGDGRRSRRRSGVRRVRARVVKF